MTAERSCLIVDDDRTICAVASIALANEGFACETASDAREAEELIARHHFDVLITDLRMPGKNGHALSVEVAAKPLGPMIVVFTGCHEPRLAKDLLKRGVDDVMFKPIDYPLFAAKVRALLDRRQGQQLAGDDEVVAPTGALTSKASSTPSALATKTPEQPGANRSKAWRLLFDN